MRVVDRKTFLTLPDGTLYAKFGDELGTPGHSYFGEVRIKEGARGPNDWWSVGFTDGFVGANDSSEWGEQMDKLAAGEESAPVDFETLDCDGLFDDGQLFAVFSASETDAMIARLQQARRNLDPQT